MLLAAEKERLQETQLGCEICPYLIKLDSDYV